MRAVLKRRNFWLSNLKIVLDKTKIFLSGNNCKLSEQGKTSIEDKGKFINYYNEKIFETNEKEKN